MVVSFNSEVDLYRVYLQFIDEETDGHRDNAINPGQPIWDGTRIWAQLCLTPGSGSRCFLPALQVHDIRVVWNPEAEQAWGDLIGGSTGKQFPSK